MKDQNITIDVNHLDEKILKGQGLLIYYGKLSYTIHI